MQYSCVPTKNIDGRMVMEITFFYLKNVCIQIGTLHFTDVINLYHTNYNVMSNCRRGSQIFYMMFCNWCLLSILVTGQ